MRFLFLRAIKAHFVLLLTSFALFTIGCEDNEHDDHEEGHTDAEGFKLEDATGAQIYKQFAGSIEGSINVNPGDTLELSVHFLDDDGIEIEHDEEEGDDHEDGLEVSVEDSNIAIVEVEGHEEGDDHDHDEHGMAIHVIGVAPGSTNFELRLMHQGHADFTSLDVLVTVGP